MRGRNASAHAGLGSADAPQRRGVPVLDSGVLRASRRVQLRRAAEAPQAALAWQRAAGGGYT